ncbi:MAG: molybdopterin cofactor-binding domain-containing protein [Gemmataceae bacterium]
MADGKVSGPGGTELHLRPADARQEAGTGDRRPGAGHAPDRWKVAGTSLPKVNGRAFVTGGHRYTLRPAPARHAVRTGAASAVVRGETDGVAHGEGGGDARRGGRSLRRLRRGGGVDRRAGRGALAALEAEWTETPQPSSDELYKRLRSTGRGRRAPGSGRAGFDGADTVLEATYTISYIAHSPLESSAALAEWSDGKLTVRTGTQMPFRVQGELAVARCRRTACG